ncbi:hypothetical protein [Noviherbaspirillum malthae]|jgi:hypothetical protein|uniref:hypothetical protein n=1 Tax=Noviherbaspirillum malthae TaxID=1260987 RepID=UPI00188FED84|nr:hypothetical protein [Noviherbaspirillum malthae]
MQRILLAGREEEIAFPLNALRNDFELVTCTDWHSAQAELDGSISLVLCGAHFDEGHLYDFARQVKIGYHTTHIPFYGIVVNGADFSHRFMPVIRAALKVMGAQGALNLAGLREECGDRQASAMLLTAVEGILMEAASERYVHLPLRRLSVRTASPHRHADVRPPGRKRA